VNSAETAISKRIFSSFRHLGRKLSEPKFELAGDGQHKRDRDRPKLPKSHLISINVWNREQGILCFKEAIHLTPQVQVAIPAPSSNAEIVPPTLRVSH
jgi:hypothetical protein